MTKCFASLRLSCLKSTGVSRQIEGVADTQCSAGTCLSWVQLVLGSFLNPICTCASKSRLISSTVSILDVVRETGLCGLWVFLDLGLCLINACSTYLVKCVELWILFSLFCGLKSLTVGTCS